MMLFRLLESLTKLKNVEKVPKYNKNEMILGFISLSFEWRARRDSNPQPPDS